MKVGRRERFQDHEVVVHSAADAAYQPSEEARLGISRTHETKVGDRSGRFASWDSIAKLQENLGRQLSPCCPDDSCPRTHELKVGSASAFQVASPRKTSEWKDQVSDRRPGEASMPAA